MDFFKLISFLIVVLVLFLPILQRYLKARYLKKHPELARRHQEEELEEEDDDEEEETGTMQVQKPVQTYKRPVPLPPPPTIRQEESTKSRRLLKNFQFQSDLDIIKEVSTVKSREFTPNIRSRAEPKIVSSDLDIESSGIARRPQVEAMTTHVHRLVRGGHIGKEMMLMHEILSPPKSLQ
jgi:hypothetical protein